MDDGTIVSTLASRQMPGKASLLVLRWGQLGRLESEVENVALSHVWRWASLGSDGPEIEGPDLSSLVLSDGDTLLVRTDNP